MPEGLESLDLAFDAANLRVLNIALGIVMFGVALGLTVEDFLRLFRKPRLPLLGLSSQWILLPLWTLGLILVARPPTGIALGLCLVACCPGGNVSNFLVDFARGNAALSVTLTLVSSFLAAFLTPVVFGLLSEWLPALEGAETDIVVNLADMTLLLLASVLVPLLLGMAVRHFAEPFAARIRGPVQVLSLLILIAFIVIAFLSNRENFLTYLGAVFLIVVVHNAGALALGWLWPTVMKVKAYDRKAISLETGIQNSGLGLIIIFNFFDGYGPMALVAAFWGTWHLVTGFAIASFWRRSAPEGANESA